MDSASEQSVVARVEGRAGTILMNRPRALNALNGEMIAAIGEAAVRFRDDPAVSLVVLEGAGGRAFCAGGDVRAIRDAAVSGDAATVERFFIEEYAVNRAIAEYPKPWVSLIDGVCMGGGIGVSVHGSHRVVTESAMLAMPETAIALFPDVGTSFVLPRLPGQVGMWLALTGARLRGAKAVEAGLATHFVPKERLPDLRPALVEGDASAADRLAAPVPPGAITANREAMDRCFAGVTVPAILGALDAEGTEWAAAQAATIRRMSPTSLSVTHELLRRGATMSLPECLEMELRLTRAVTRHPDFAEGVRAVVVEKDGAPRWSPPRLEEVSERDVAAMFG